MSSQSGTIERSELVDALKGMFPVDPGVLEKKINENWATWDTDGNGILGKTSKSTTVRNSVPMLCRD